MTGDFDPNFPIERCHRMGARPSGDTKRSRPILVRLSFFSDRENILKQKSTLKGTNIFNKEDFPPEVEKRINKMMPSFLATKRNKDLRAKLVVDRLYLNIQCKPSIDFLQIYRLRTWLRDRMVNSLFLEEGIFSF